MLMLGWVFEPAKWRVEGIFSIYVNSPVDKNQEGISNTHKSKRKKKSYAEISLSRQIQRTYTPHKFVFVKIKLGRVATKGLTKNISFHCEKIRTIQNQLTCFLFTVYKDNNFIPTFAQPCIPTFSCWHNFARFVNIHQT